MRLSPEQHSVLAEWLVELATDPNASPERLDALRAFAAESRTAESRVAVLLPGEELRCPAGHRMKPEAWLLGDEPHGGFRCTFRYPAGQHALAQQCGRVVYIAPVQYLVADVTAAEVWRWQQARIDIPDILEQLGLRWRRDVPPK